RRWGWPRRCGGSCPRRRRTSPRRTGPWLAPRGRCGSQARRPRPARGPEPPRRRCRLRAGSGRVGRGDRHRRRSCPPGRSRPPSRRFSAHHWPSGNRGRRLILLTYVQILPSGHRPSNRGATGLVLKPFRGVRYAEARVSGLAEVTSPPYDVIASENEDQLLAADPHNVVRIIRPRHPAGQPGSSAQDAAADLRHWLAEGILLPDAEPALYVYEQFLAGQDGQPGRLQRGLIGAVELVAREAGIVQPHEAVAPGPVAGRLRLMEATQANLEPIFLLYDGAAAGTGPSAATRIVTQIASNKAPLAQATTADGIRHRLWAVTDAAELDQIAADLKPRTALIADGHHRYAAYRELQRRREEAGDGAGPWDFGLALLVDSAAYPPQLGAIHRVIPGLDARLAAEHAASAFSVQEIAGGTKDIPAVLDELADAGRDGVAF